MVGAIYATEGVATTSENFKLVKKIGDAGNKIQNHNHPGYDVLFTVVKGSVEVVLNDEEVYLVYPGSVLHFDGKNTIGATFVEESEVFVTLIKQ